MPVRVIDGLHVVVVVLEGTAPVPDVLSCVASLEKLFIDALTDITNGVVPVIGVEGVWADGNMNISRAVMIALKFPIPMS